MHIRRRNKNSRNQRKVVIKLFADENRVRAEGADKGGIFEKGNGRRIMPLYYLQLVVFFYLPHFLLDISWDSYDKMTKVFSKRRRRGKI